MGASFSYTPKSTVGIERAKKVRERGTLEKVDDCARKRERRKEGHPEKMQIHLTT